MKVSIINMVDYGNPRAINMEGIVGFIFEVDGIKLEIKTYAGALHMRGGDSNISIEPISSNVVLIRPIDYLSDDGWK